MGVIIRVKDADFSANPVGFVPPVVPGLSYWNFFGGNAAHNGRNLAPGQPSAEVYGSPVVNEHSATMQGAELGYVLTQAEQTADMTVIAVAKPLKDGVGQVVSNYAGAGSGSSLYFQTGAPDDGMVVASYGNAVTDGSASNNGLAPNYAPLELNLPYCFAGRSRASGLERKFWAYTLGQTKESSYGDTYTSTAFGPETMKIGAADDRSFGAPGVEIYMAAIYNTALTDTQVEEVLAYLRAYYGRRGITI